MEHLSTFLEVEYKAHGDHGSLEALHFQDKDFLMLMLILFARSSLPSLQTIYFIAGILAVIAGVLYSRMSMS